MSELLYICNQLIKQGYEVVKLDSGNHLDHHGVTLCDVGTLDTAFYWSKLIPENFNKEFLCSKCFEESFKIGCPKTSHELLTMHLEHGIPFFSISFRRDTNTETYSFYSPSLIFPGDWNRQSVHYFREIPHMNEEFHPKENLYRLLNAGVVEPERAEIGYLEGLKKYHILKIEKARATYQQAVSIFKRDIESVKRIARNKI